MNRYATRHLFIVLLSAVSCHFALFAQTPPDTTEIGDSVNIHLEKYYWYLSDLNNNLNKLEQIDSVQTYNFIVRQAQSWYMSYRYPEPVRVPYLRFLDSVPAYSETRIDHAWILQGLLNAQDSGVVKRKTELRKLRNRLTMEMKAADALMRNTMEYDPVDYRPFLRNILNRAEYQPREPVRDKNILAEAIEWIFKKLWELLKDILKPLSPPSSAPVVAPPAEISLIGQGLIYIVYAVGAVLLIIVIWKLIRFYRNRNKEPESAEQKSFDLILEPGETQDPDEHFTLAESAARNRDYRRAIRHLLLSVILQLDKKDYVRFENFKTNREYLERVLSAEVSFKAVLHANLSGIMMIFDRSWYGMRPAGLDEYKLCLQSYRECMRFSEPVFSETRQNG